jgi:hypothetical protein
LIYSSSPLDSAFGCRNGRTLIVWVTLNSMIGALFGILFFNQVGL